MEFVVRDLVFDIYQSNKLAAPSQHRHDEGEQSQQEITETKEAPDDDTNLGMHFSFGLRMCSGKPQADDAQNEGGDSEKDTKARNDRKNAKVISN